jgi:hypothetical protein
MFFLLTAVSLDSKVSCGNLLLPTNPVVAERSFFHDAEEHPPRCACIVLGWQVFLAGKDCSPTSAAR